MEYCAGGEIKWRTSNNEPTLRVNQTRRIIRDVINGLQYRMFTTWLAGSVNSSFAVHYQGIIHRDIKPANLMWSTDRQVVKIGDFGVSHFSLAQRIAAAGEEAADETPDPILLDESDLSKFAGTPMFLAPEVVADTSSDLPSETNTTLTASEDVSSTNTPRRRPAITKAIDIWALGVTIYCLLFGDLPFKGDSEFAIYRSIREDDWAIPTKMGKDEVQTEGRHPKKFAKVNRTEGALLIELLEGLLKKDPVERFTLQQAKVQSRVIERLTILLMCHVCSRTNGSPETCRLPTSGSRKLKSATLYGQPMRKRVLRCLSSASSGQSISHEP